jgi:hypothetical protein
MYAGTYRRRVTTKALMKTSLPKDVITHIINAYVGENESDYVCEHKCAYNIIKSGRGAACVWVGIECKYCKSTVDMGQRIKNQINIYDAWDWYDQVRVVTDIVGASEVNDTTVSTSSTSRTWMAVLVGIVRQFVVPAACSTSRL